MSFKYFCLIICIIIGTCSSLNLIPSPSNPLQLNPANNANTGQQIDIKFSFPSAKAGYPYPYANGSGGLSYKQFFGVQFASTFGTELGFDAILLNNPKWSCLLTDGTNSYTVTAVVPILSPITSSLTVENYIAYCRLDDTSANMPLKTGPAVSYTLSIILSGVKIVSSQFMRNIGLFTSTSNNPEKMIIDSIPVLGSMAQYTDPTAFATKAVDIASSSIAVNSVVGATTLYPYQSFDVYMTLKINTFITANDFIFVIRYPTACFTGPTSVITVAASSDPMQVAVGGTPLVSPFGTGAFYISGITEDLIPGRQFQIVMKAWKALDLYIGIAQTLELDIYYRNTYSQISYTTVSLITISRSILVATANHPEFWDIHRNGAWPMTFTFNSPSDLTNGGIVVIQHSNAIDGNGVAATPGNKFSFIASTCDFSGNDSTFDNTFGNRPTCYPYKLENSYTANALTPYAGSAIFFNMKKIITGGKTYTVTVWAFADNCGGTTTDFNTSPTLVYVIPNFQISVWKTLDPTMINDGRFYTTSNNNAIIAQSVSQPFTGKCWNNLLSIIPGTYYSPYSFDAAADYNVQNDSA